MKLVPSFEQKISLPEDYKKGDIFLAAVSGGADSTAMLRALCALRETAGFVLHCAHVDHALRGAESAGDAAFTAELCKKLNVPCAILCIGEGIIKARARREGLGLEAAARAERLAALDAEAKRLCAGGTKVYILTAHTRDDFLETVLLRLLRGSGPAGLAGIRQKNGAFFRPILNITRAEVIDYLRKIGQDWREDASNAGTEFTRNRLRNMLVPVIRANFPGWENALVNFAEIQRQAACFISDCARPHIIKRDENSVYIENIEALPLIAACEAVFLAIDELDTAPISPRQTGGMSALPDPDPPRSRVRGVRREALSAWIAGGGKCLDVGAYSVTRENGGVLARKKKIEVSGEGFAVVLKQNGRHIIKNLLV
ncbi:MAG: tRNA lysidine(34) synthetase TilS [Spirochaetaceae bacterium]|jgi:tRNA(Ile)-lysidine synthase|nr:tRNA lysidine(34) synthetase TilS [Spirochaetaceae bacterium]